MASPISSLKYEKCHWSGASTTPSSEMKKLDTILPTVISQRSGATTSRTWRIRLRSEVLGHCDELIERRAPPLVEAHLLVRGPGLGRAVHGDRPVSRAGTGRLQRDDGSEREVADHRPESGTKRRRPHEAPIFDHLEYAARVLVDGLTLGRAHHRTEDPAGTQIDLALDRFVGLRREPLPDVLGDRPRSPDQMRGDVHLAFEHEVKLWIDRVRRFSHDSDSLRVWTYSSNRSSRRSHSRRWAVIQSSTASSGCGVSRKVRTRPYFVERTSPARSTTSRCWRKDGSAIANGRASSEVAAGPRPKRSTTARRVGSARAWNRRSSVAGC